MVFIITFASMFFSWFVRFLLDFFMSTGIFFPGQSMIFDPPSNPEDSARFTFSLLTSWSNQGLVLSQYGLYGGYFLPF